MGEAEQMILPGTQILQRKLPASKPTIFCFAFLSWCLCIISVARCTFFSVESNDGDDIMGMGLFSRAVYDRNEELLGCVAYTDTEFFDTMFRTGRAFGMVSALSSTILLIFLTATLFFYPKGCEVLWNASRFYSAAATIGQMFSFVVLSGKLCQTEGQSCQLLGVGRLALVNVIILAGLTVKLFFEDAPKQAWLYLRSTTFEDGTVATDHTGSLKRGAGKETLNIMDPFSAEFVPCEQETGRVQSPDEMNPRMQTFAATQSRCSGSIGSHSLQDTLASNIGVQNLRSFRLMTIFLLIISWAISIVGIRRCTMFLVGPTAGARSDFSGLGLFSRAAYHQGDLIGCLAYPEQAQQHFDPSFQVSRVFGAITGFLMTAILLLGCIQLFVTVGKDEIWLFLRALLPCAAVTQSLVFIGYKTETCSITDLIECRLGPTGVVVIINVALLLILSVGVIALPPPPGPIFRFNRSEPRRNPQTRNQMMDNRALNQPNHIQDGTPTICARDKLLLSPKGYSRNSVNTVKSPHLQSMLDPIPEGSTSVAANSEENISDDEKSRRKVVRIDEDKNETITIRVEYSPTQKTTIKTVTHVDGSQTITTTVEEIVDINDTDDSSSDESDDVDGHSLEDNDTDGLALSSDVTSRSFDHQPMKSDKSDTSETADVTFNKPCLPAASSNTYSKVDPTRGRTPALRNSTKKNPWVQLANGEWVRIKDETEEDNNATPWMAQRKALRRVEAETTKPPVEQAPKFVNRRTINSCVTDDVPRIVTTTCQNPASKHNPSDDSSWMKSTSEKFNNLRLMFEKR